MHESYIHQVQVLLASFGRKAYGVSDLQGSDGHTHRLWMDMALSSTQSCKHKYLFYFGVVLYTL